MSFMMETALPEQPETVVLAVDHAGLRFHLTRELLAHGIFTSLVSDGDCAAHRLGEGVGPDEAPRVIVAQCRSGWSVRALLRRVRTLGWHRTTVFLVGAPDEARDEAHRRGAILVEEDVEPEALSEVVLEQTAAA